MKGNVFKNSAEVDYSNKEIFKIFKKMAKQDFPRFNEKNPIGTNTKKKIGAYSTKTAEAYIEITDFKENEVYEITTVISKTNVTHVSRYTLTYISDEKTLFTLEESQGGAGFIMTLNHIFQSIFYKNRLKNRFQYLLAGLDAEIKQTRERTGSKKKVTDEIAISESSDESIKEKDAIIE